MSKLQILALMIAVAVPASAATLSITGSVVNEDGQPVGPAKVYVYDALPKVGASAVCPSCYRDCGKVAEVDSEGEFHIDEVSDALKFRLLATADGYEPAFSPHFAPGQKAAFRLGRRASSDASRLVRGCVVDPEGRPVRGAVVARQAVRAGRRIGYGEIPGTDPLSITDERGEFVLRVPDAQTKLDVRVRARNFAPRIERELGPGEPPRTIRVDIGSTIVGRVMHQGRPVAGVPVTFTQPDRRSHFYLGDDEIGTDEQGRFVMTGLGTDTDYAVYVSMQAAAPLTFPIARATTRDDGSMADVGDLGAIAGRRVSGCVRAAGLVPAATRVSLLRSSFDTPQVVEVGSDGAFAFEGVPNESVTLAVHALGFETQRIELPPSGRDVAGVILPLRR